MLLTLTTTHRPATDLGYLLHKNPANAQQFDAGIGTAHRHTAAHTIVVRQGRLRASGREVGPQAYAHFPAGEVMHHEAAGDEPCLFVLTSTAASTSRWSRAASRPPPRRSSPPRWARCRRGVPERSGTSSTGWCGR